MAATSPDLRARQRRLLLDGYRLPSGRRVSFVEHLIEFAVRDAAAEATAHAVHPGSDVAVTAEGYPLLWAVTWRTLSADWMLRNRRLLERAIRGPG